MKILETLGAQGEVRIYRIDAIPSGVKPMKKERGHWIIGQSETHHDHVLVAERAQVFEADTAPEGMRILYAVLDSAGTLEHLRGHDTHAPHAFEPGDTIMFRTDREYDPYAELARRVAD
ncbi:hypothetical protein V5F77_05375 [Xanthobacter sp. DSM 24535]|uniref:hypothetical protein n=1 Tax=Roseixanthobacter psychrophilus TaxID=3119917 RepID=UPI00372C23B0